MEKFVDKIGGMTRAHNDAIAALAGVKGMYDELYEAIGDDIGWVDACGYMPRTVYLYFTGDRNTLNFVFGALRKLGYEPDKRPEEKQTKYTANFTRERDGNKETVELNFSSTVCRMVQIGTKTVEQPVYEVVCDYAPAAEPQPEVF